MDGSSETSPPSATAPLAAWLGAQLAVLAGAALRVPLAAEYPQPAERVAAYWVLGAQVVLAGMLFPWVLRDARIAAQVMAAAVPFQVAAAVLSGTPIDEIVRPAIYVLVWLWGLACWAGKLTSPRSQMLGVAIANCLTLGAGAVRYLRSEYGDPTAASDAPENALPLLTTFAALNREPSGAGLAVLVAFLIAGGVEVVWEKRRERNRASLIAPSAVNSSPDGTSISSPTRLTGVASHRLRE